jgi:hypothetical protein
MSFACDQLQARAAIVIIGELRNKGERERENSHRYRGNPPPASSGPR